MGLSGSLVMAVQSVSLAVAGVLVLRALDREFAGARSDALALGELAVIFLGFTLIFDLVGVLLLSGAFRLHTRALTPGSGLDAEMRRQQLARYGTYAFAFLAVWVLITLAWRAAAATIVQFFPTPFGGELTAIPAGAVQAALVVLPIWVLAALVQFLGAYQGSRFLRGLRDAPLTFPRFLWPLETFVHFVAAVGLALLAPVVLANPAVIEITTLRTGLALLLIDFVVVPVLGVLAYVFLSQEFLRLLREARSPHTRSGPVPEDSGGEP